MSSIPYDLAVVLGLRFGERWQLRNDLKRSLDKAVQLYVSGQTKAILVSGRWTIWYDWLHITPPVTEAGLMRQYLLEHGVPAKAVYMERHSKDTLGNIYKLKLFSRRHPELKRMVIICEAQKKARVEYLVHTFFGADHNLSIYAMRAREFEQSSLGQEAQTLADYKALLRGVRPGHEEDLGKRLYARPYYRQRARTAARRLNGKPLEIAGPELNMPRGLVESV